MPKTPSRETRSDKLHHQHSRGQLQQQRAPSNTDSHDANAESMVAPSFRQPANNLPATPRYLTRGSLGSVAFSPGRSPGSTAPSSANAATRLRDLAKNNNNEQDPANASYEQYDREHRKKSASYLPHTQQAQLPIPTSAPEAGLLDYSPDIQQLEFELAAADNYTLPATHAQPHIAMVMQATSPTESATPANTSNTSSNSMSARRSRADRPAALDLSPPKPSWMRSNEQHPIIQSSVTTTQDERVGIAASSSQFHNRNDEPANTSHTSSANTSKQGYAGLGLGLPFATSQRSDSLASLPSSSSLGEVSVLHSHSRAQHPSYLASPISSVLNGGRQSATTSLVSAVVQSPNAVPIRRQRSESELLSSPEESRSPNLDRRGLIGLGELSTPRWTAAMHEKRWNHHPLPAPMPNQQHLDERAESNEDDDWQGDVLERYIDEKEVRTCWLSWRVSERPALIPVPCLLPM